eukprot:gnl/Dysnectes_brevis/1541_a1749_3544.p1 GENE.gnl/Dysnectes_brevis/1541_a1749_3544~~gnl/Dysnectes_brevis/1541_a1749_3544.p1  ORF type:complete len:535 (+),score=211.26 gnl/Dysnectes_brevis/1541_a1749_3544:30-1634(+)
MLSFFFIVAVLLAVCKADRYGVNSCGDDCFVVVSPPDLDSIVFAEFEDSLNVTGWSPIQIVTNSDWANDLQMKAAGYIEGYLFPEHLYNHRLNLNDWFLFDYVPGGVWPDELYVYLQENLDWTRQQSDRLASSDPLWRQVQYTLNHFDGLVAGYNKAATPDRQLSELDMWMYLASGDLLDVVNFIEPSLRPDPEHMTPEELTHRFEVDSHCSGLIRMNDDFSDVYVSQVAWFFLGAQTRVAKTYELNLNDNDMPIRRIAMSSYPGFLYSFDDFILNDHEILAIETTNDVFVESLYDACSSHSIFTWIRSSCATRLATSGEEWIKHFRRYNSGTYNNQWAITDLKRFVPGTGVRDGFLWILEQIPGYSESADVTDVFISNGNYWPSYNIPYFQDIFNISGYFDLAVTDITWDYNMCPRAQIFRRDAVDVQTLEQMERMMRYNQWQTDPLSLGNAGNAPASRYDLRTDDTAMAFGAFDAKIASYGLLREGIAFHAISSPTYDDQTPWSFRDDLYCPRRGLPDGPFMYEWQQFFWEI